MEEAPTFAQETIKKNP